MINQETQENDTCVIENKGTMTLGGERLIFTSWKTECGHLFQEVNGDETAFCPFCGKRTGTVQICRR